MLCIAAKALLNQNTHKVPPHVGNLELFAIWVGGSGVSATTASVATVATTATTQGFQAPEGPSIII